MSEHEGHETNAPKPDAAANDASSSKRTTLAAPAGEAASATEGATLSDLMATAAEAAPKRAAELDREALRAAEQALQQGQRALAAARAHLGEEPPPPPRGSRRRELVLRGLLVFNVMAMLAVMSLPVPKTAGGDGEATTPPPAPVSEPAPTTPGTNYREPWNRAMAAADRRDFATAITILEGYLSPRMAPSEQLSVLMALAHYSARLGRFEASQEYQRRADAIDKSHSLPEDLVAEAKAAAASGDQESLRRIWARFLLQQRQVPSWLYKHVAEAYLQLGDSYRLEADAAAEQARLEELQRTAEALRAKAAGERGR